MPAWCGKGGAEVIRVLHLMKDLGRGGAGGMRSRVCPFAAPFRGRSRRPSTDPTHAGAGDLTLAERELF
jgi:hypothetical protein